MVLLRERVEKLWLLLGLGEGGWGGEREAESFIGIFVIDVVADAVHWGLGKSLELLRSSESVEGLRNGRWRSSDTGEVGVVQLRSKLRRWLRGKLLGSELLRSKLLRSELLRSKLLRSKLLRGELLRGELLRSGWLRSKSVEGLWSRCSWNWCYWCHGKRCNGLRKMVSLCSESFRFTSVVLNSLQHPELIKVTIFSFNVAINIAGLHFEGTISSFVTESVGSIIVDVVNLLQNSYHWSCGLHLSRVLTTDVNCHHHC